MRKAEPFYRSKEIQERIAQAMLIPDLVSRLAALAGIPQYRSRGHGGKYRPQFKYGTMHSIYKRVAKSSNGPHTGAKQIAKMKTAFLLTADF